MGGTTTTDTAERTTATGDEPYRIARGLAGMPFPDAAHNLQRALAVAPGDVDLNALRLWLALRRHRAGPATIRAVNRMLACVPLLDRPLTAGNAFGVCVEARGAGLQETDPRRYFHYATLAHAAGLAAFHQRFGGALAVEHRGRQYLLQAGDRRVIFNVEGPRLGLHFDFFFVHEPGMWDWFAGFTPDDVLLDVGANVGIYSVAAAGLRGCRVVGLEPFPVNLAAARANVAANRLEALVTILPVAAAARSAHGRLSHDEAVPGVAAQAFHAVDEALPDGKSGLSVAGAAIDDLVASGTIPFPTRIKIDVDGGEGAVVAGMQATLADPRLDSVRLEIRWWEPGKQAVVDGLRRHGFEPQVADDPKNLLFRRRPAAAAR
jgi:FkbM family methyltransferase